MLQSTHGGLSAHGHQSDRGPVGEHGGDSGDVVAGHETTQSRPGPPDGLCSPALEQTRSVRACMTREVELSALDLRYESYRMKNPGLEARLVASIAQRGIEEPLEGGDTNEQILPLK